MSQAANQTLSLSKIKKAELAEESDSKTLFGFWVYLMTDCVLFASLFATYAVLHNNTYNGLPGYKLFNLHYALAETMILLVSSFSCGLAILAANSRKLRHVYAWLSLTFVLGLTFLIMEISEFHKFAAMGDSWRRSGFLSSYFTLVGTHGLHITIGLLWLATMMFRLRRGLTRRNVRQLTILSIFWHFLDVIWIFIFTVVYLLSVVNP
jgi:cytochrome o ubiquinol oxidase subunit 3